jgi:hypothetical protein
MLRISLFTNFFDIPQGSEAVIFNAHFSSFFVIFIKSEVSAESQPGGILIRTTAFIWHETTFHSLGGRRWGLAEVGFDVATSGGTDRSRGFRSTPPFGIGLLAAFGGRACKHRRYATGEMHVTRCGTTCVHGLGAHDAGTVTLLSLLLWCAEGSVCWLV